MEDPTESRRAEPIHTVAELFQSMANASPEPLAKGISHNFNNLLAAILASAENALAAHAEGLPIEEELQNIRIASIRGAELVQKLKIYGGDDTNTLEPLDLTKLQGPGLGLAVAEKMLREHGAERTVVSALGCGTTFQAWFPAAEKLQADTISAAGGQKASKRGTILVVEDEELLRAAVVKGLGRSGFFVLEASDGAGALKVIRSDPGRIDSILLDIVLPGKISSRTVFEEARRIKPGVKIILTSAYTEETAMAAFGEIYGEHFLRKPFHFADLVKLLGDKGVAR
jgi:CheY-like chemotaxis protein